MYHKCGSASTTNTHAGGQLAASAARLSGASPTRAASASIGAAGRVRFFPPGEPHLQVPFSLFWLESAC